tara:strand:- start:299 stop:598 length:300 start_codon:yes stop_codon:yes gene_type:complete
MSFLFLYSPKVSVIFDISFSNSFFWVASFVSNLSMFDFSLIISKQGPHFSTIVDFSPFSLPNLDISFLAACHTEFSFSDNNFFLLSLSFNLSNFFRVHL